MPGKLLSRSNVLAALLLLWLASPVAALHASSASQSVIVEAGRLRDDGDLAAAARLLTAHYAANPDDVAAARMLAQTLYWMGERTRARAIYGGALQQHPGDAALRCEFARMQVETGEREHARLLLAPLRQVPAWRVEAIALLGTVAYWDSDLAGAARLFREALAGDPGHAEARRQLDEIRHASATWVQVAPAVWHDDQPLDRAGLTLEAGWFATPVTPIVIRVNSRRYTAGGLTLTAPVSEVEISHFAPSSRVETKLAAGMLRRSTGPDENAWVGRGEVGLRLPHGVRPSARVERMPYFYTTASLASPVWSTTVAGGMTWNDPRGWMADAEHRRQRFHDGNVVRTSYGWLLAPVLRRQARGQRTEFHAGYAFSTRDSDELRYSPAARYEPYHTPLDETIHSAVASLRVAHRGGGAINVGLSYGVHATELAPMLPGDEAQPAALGERRFTPVTVRGGIQIPLARALSLTANGEAGRGAFYQWRTLSVGGIYRFLPSREPRAAHR